ncbi:hypothetical protein R3P38DRAFT_2799726 [Favolaschia claudopus]|uniref:Uncharacterized protein n=1 Tax=Favolaschia claudopus TaxID=2862362 RepID=A0AAW0A015_9AGAR
MGRSAKHLTLLERASASRESTSKYSTSPHGRANHTASKQQARRRRAAKPFLSLPNLLPGIPPPTERMLDLRDQPLPLDSPLFAQALRSADALDESDLGRWKAEPPFEEDEDPMDPYSEGYHRFTNSLSAVLHGVRLREQRLRDTNLQEEVDRKGLQAVLSSIQVEVRELLLCWGRVERLLGAQLYHPFHQSRESVMLEHHFQWLARTICHLSFLEFLH